ncbi:hypothetical protein CPU12_11155 [Malaciobacter molluscorum LMG 25693]|uniref:beta-lactamase n=1 Tax=Malaciobacter molluscorum LMG 25693 TaxID=870501 RepID=A0A2G1DFJ5_9BACT|nr:SEL1-like repeat protein [Malaciobacter molluscorum]AXX93587.1 Sel1 domain-containing protein [Malaciobacter molluscorum LMG 25693]PHO17259.1 hypothetical protein CPU12_11155 [Malaciobacter molluscorum LMG 25693]
MKILTPLLIVFLFFTGCTNLNLDTANVDSKENLIKDVNNKDIKAMIDLAKYYDFPKTKEGLYLFNKWYKTVKNSTDSQSMQKIADVYLKNHDMFIDGENKALNLYKKSYAMGNLDAAVKLIEYYSNTYKKDEKKQIEDAVLNKLSDSQIIELYSFYKNKYKRKDAENLLTLMNKKGLKEPFEFRLKEFKSLIYYIYKEDSKQKYDEFIKDVIASKNIENMLKTAKVLKSKYKYLDAIKVYNEILKLDDTKAEIYADLSEIYSRGSYRESLSRDKEKSLEYLQKAFNLNDTNAAKDLLNHYSTKPEYIDDYEKLVTKLKKSDEGKFILAKFYQIKRKKDKADSLLNELANDGYKDAILELATKSVSTYNFNPEDYKLIKKWQDYILKSNDIKLKQDLLKKLDTYYYRKNYKNTIESLKKDIASTKETAKINILDLRELAQKNKYSHPKEALEYYKKAASYGDVFSKRALASMYLNRDFKEYDKAVEILKALMKEGDYKSGMQLASLYRYPSYLYEKNIPKGIKVYEYYAKQDDINSIEKLQRIYLCGPCNDNKDIDYEKAFYYTQRLVDLRGKGSDYASLGWHYQYSKGIKEDLQKAKQYYLKAVEKGYYQAYYNLAWLYYRENDKDAIIRLDYKEAKKYLEEGVKYRDNQCMNLLGVFYKNGYGVKKDFDKAIYYLKPIAKYYKYPAFNLAEIYKSKKQYKLAKEYYEISAKKQKAASQLELGILYEKGLGAPKDVEKAVLYYQDAYANKLETEQKDIAAYNIGLVYEYGKGEYKKDIKKAIQWYKRSNTKKAKQHLKKLQKAKR